MKAWLVILVALNLAECIFLTLVVLRIIHLEDLVIGDALEEMVNEAHQSMMQEVQRVQEAQRVFTDQPPHN